jgi:hypothetical protein
MAPDGTAYDIQLLYANEQLRRGDMGKLLVASEATGEQTEAPLWPEDKNPLTPSIWE